MVQGGSAQCPRRTWRLAPEAQAPFGESRMPLQRIQHTVSRSAAASESAFASGGSGHSAMGADRRDERRCYGALMPPSPNGRHRTWRKRLRRWRLGDSMSIVSCGGPAPPFEGVATARGVSAFGGGDQGDSRQSRRVWRPGASFRKSFASERSRPSPRKGVAPSPRDPAATDYGAEDAKNIDSRRG